jgi:hypothetical protein
MSKNQKLDGRTKMVAVIPARDDGLIEAINGAGERVWVMAEEAQDFGDAHWEEFVESVMPKTVEYGTKKPLHFSLDDTYWNLIWQLSHMAGGDTNEYTQRRLMDALVDDAIGIEYLGQLISAGLLSDLKDHPHFKMTGK